MAVNDKAFFDPRIVRVSDIAWPYLYGTGLVAATVGAAAVFHVWLDESTRIMLFLAPVIWSAIRHGRLPSVFTGIVAALAANFFFFEPYFAFGLQTVHDGVTTAVFLGVGLIIGTLAARLREQGERFRRQAKIARQRSRELATLYALSQEANEAADREDLVRRVAACFKRRAGIEVRLEFPGDEKSAGARVPLRTASGTIGALVADLSSAPPHDAQRHRHLMQAASEMIAVAVERAALHTEMENARIQAESEKLRAALLASVSHDFRTPLGSIMGAASTLLSPDAGYAPETQRNLLTGVLQSAERLNRYVRNILDITAIEAGAVKPKLDWVDLEDLVGAALAAVEPVYGERAVRLALPPDLPPLRLDFVLIERVLINLLENAAKFSPPDADIAVLAARDGDRVAISVFNGGILVPEEQLPLIFTQFYRGGSEVRGTGLGLAICKGFMAAHGGEIRAERDEAAGGMKFLLSFPIETPPPPPEDIDDE